MKDDELNFYTCIGRFRKYFECELKEATLGVRVSMLECRNCSAPCSQSALSYGSTSQSRVGRVGAETEPTKSMA
eukprot:2448828-Amphidinium_carterae.1